jgi:hypothetical protein
VTYSVFVREALDSGDWTLLTSGVLPQGLTSSFEWQPAQVDQVFLKVEGQ